MNSISGIVNRPAAIQFGKSRPPVPKTMEELLAEDDAVVNIEEENEGTITPPVPNRAFLPPPRLLPRAFTDASPLARRLVDAFNRTENHRDIGGLPQEERPAEDNSEGAEPLQTPNREELSPLQRHLRLLDEFNDFNPQNVPTALFFLNSPSRNAARALSITEQQEAQRANLMPTQAQLAAIRGDSRSGTPDSVSDLNQQNQSD